MPNCTSEDTITGGKGCLAATCSSVAAWPAPPRAPTQRTPGCHAAARSTVLRRHQAKDATRHAHVPYHRLPPATRTARISILAAPVLRNWRNMAAAAARACHAARLNGPAPPVRRPSLSSRLASSARQRGPGDVRLPATLRRDGPAPPVAVEQPCGAQASAASRYLLKMSGTTRHPQRPVDCSLWATLPTAAATQAPHNRARRRVPHPVMRARARRYCERVRTPRCRVQ
jgi:hypothetical protein